MASSRRPSSPRGRRSDLEEPRTQHRRTDSDASALSPSRASITARLATPVVGSFSANPSPSRPAHDGDQDVADQTPLAGASGTSLSGPGTSSLSQALRGSFGGQSPTLGPSRPRGPTSAADIEPSAENKSPRLPGTSQLSHQPSISQLGRSPRTEDIEILKRHLVNPSHAGSEAGSFRRGGKFPADTDSIADNEEFSSLQLQGGDTTRHIYRYAQKMEQEQAEAGGRDTGRLRRSHSASFARTEGDEEAGISSIQVPGGFRREHIRRVAASPAPSSVRHRSKYGTVAPSTAPPARQQPQFVANNFIEFLTLYGHFAGEVLEEDDEVLGPDEYFSSDANDDGSAYTDDDRHGDGQGEGSALLGDRDRRRRRKKTRESGKGSPFGAAMLLLKSFVGTGVLFLPRAYLNGGMVFSNLVLLFVALLSYYCFILLVDTRLKVHASFGDMGGKIYGNYFRMMINFSLVISQMGFTSAYIVFVSENLQAFVLAITNCRTRMDIGWFILIQTAIFLPISLYRNINNIQKMALIADLFIALGLIYLYYYDIKTIVDHHGVADIKAFNPKDWTLFIGTAIFTFEGVGLVIPIQSGMKHPGKFPKVLAIVMVVISVVFISAGAVSYAAYGSKTKTVILLNFPQESKLVNAVQFLYSLAILLSTPLQIYPAIEITSQQLFSRTGKYNPWIKWKKNIFRFFMVALCAGIAYAGANDLDKFVALVGSFACIPLVYIYPPMMHYRVSATRLWQKLTDVALVVFGFAIMAYATALTIIAWVNGDEQRSPGYCDK